jgi:fructokinase
MIEVPGRTVEVIDTVGAGDTVTAALLVGLGQRGALGAGGGIALLDDVDIRAILEQAAVAASITCSREGAQPPTAADVVAAMG